MKPWQVLLTPEAERLLQEIQDRRIRKAIKDRALRLANDPEKQGKPLSGDLAGLRSVRAVGQRYRIVYELNEAHREVWVIAVGIRRKGARDDVYERLKKH